MYYRGWIVPPWANYVLQGESDVDDFVFVEQPRHYSRWCSKNNGEHSDCWYDDLDGLLDANTVVIDIRYEEENE